MAPQKREKRRPKKRSQKRGEREGDEKSPREMASAVSLPASGAAKEARKLIVGTRPTDLPRARRATCCIGDFKFEIKDKLTLRRSVSRKTGKCRILCTMT